MVAGLFGGGAFASWIGKLGPILKIFADVVQPNQNQNTTNNTTPVVTEEFAKDTIELVQAAINYAAKRGDKTAQARFIQAALAEIRDIVDEKFPTISGPLNALAVAITNAFFPTTPTA